MTFRHVRKSTWGLSITTSAVCHPTLTRKVDQKRYDTFIGSLGRPEIGDKPLVKKTVH